ncbi:MAG TPA: flagellar filament capping protein FliD [Terriglobales bacterium]|nr:flagellar filament capping protein FliD [Terriglobales bacterium]
MGISLNAGTLLNGNGIDVNSLVTQVQAPIESEIQTYEQQQSGLQTQAGLLTSMNNDLSSLSSAIDSLTDVLGPLAAQTVTSSQPSIVTGSAQYTAASGDHTVIVSTLATQGTLYTDAVANADTSILPNGATSGDLAIQVGGANGTTLDAPITAGSNDTLNTLASYINSQNWGITATVLDDATGARLALYSQNTGTTGAITLVNNTTTLSFNDPIGGTNATFSVDGIPFSSTTNTVTGAIPGVTLNLLAGIPSVPVQLSVGPDVTQATDAINNFVTAYNQVLGDINTQFTVDPTTNSEGPLAGDNSLRLLQSSLLADAAYTPANGTLFSGLVQDPDASFLPSGATSGDIQLQVGGSGGTTYDVPITAGSNDTLNSLADYINQQNWGLSATVLTGGTGARLSVSNTSSVVGVVSEVANTTGLTFSQPVENTYGSLTSLGITTNDDGTLSLDPTQLSAALTSDPADVLNFFQNASLTGFANNFSNDLQNLTDPTLGVLNMDLSENQQEQSDLSDTISDLQDQMSTQQQQLLNEFSQVNALLEAYPYQLEAIDLQLGIPLNSQSSSSPTAAISSLA